MLRLTTTEMEINFNSKGTEDKDDNYTIEAQFERSYEFSEGLARVELDGLYGYINKEGNYVIEPQSHAREG